MPGFWLLATDIKEALLDAPPILEQIPLFEVTAQCFLTRTLDSVAFQAPGCHFLASNTLFFFGVRGLKVPPMRTPEVTVSF